MNPFQKYGKHMNKNMVSNLQAGYQPTFWFQKNNHNSLGPRAEEAPGGAGRHGSEIHASRQNDMTQQNLT